MNEGFGAPPARDAETSEPASGLSIEDLAAAADVPVRTIRYYIAEGLLPGPSSRGKYATYGEEQLARLRLIRRLSERHVPLAEMRELLAPLALGEIRALLAEEDRRAAELKQAEESLSPKDYVSGLLQRAQAARHPSSVTSPSVREGASSYPASSPGLASPASPAIPRDSSPVSAPRLHAPATAPTESWQRYDLAPGVELHVRMDAERRYRSLIRRLLHLANETRDTQDPTE
jgi:DNA-binding transcriptional MerR regulator